MSNITQLTLASMAAALFVFLGSAGIAGAASPASTTKLLSADNASQVTLVHRRHWRHGYRHSYRYGHHPRRYGWYGRGPTFSLYVGPQYRHWW
jgi:hypothetical protein